MKKIVKVLSAMALVLVLGVTLVACGGVTGTYECEISVMGSTVTTTLELKDGDECVMTANIGGISSEEKGTYKIDGDKITLTIDGDSLEGTIANNEIVITQDGVKMTFKKK